MGAEERKFRLKCLVRNRGWLLRVFVKNGWEGMHDERVVMGTECWANTMPWAAMDDGERVEGESEDVGVVSRVGGLGMREGDEESRVEGTAKEEGVPRSLILSLFPSQTAGDASDAVEERERKGSCGWGEGGVLVRAGEREREKSGEGERGDGDGGGCFSSSALAVSSTLRGAKREEVAAARRGFEACCVLVLCGVSGDCTAGGEGEGDEKGERIVIRGEVGGEVRRRGETGRMGVTRRMVSVGLDGCEEEGEEDSEEGMDDGDSVQGMGIVEGEVDTSEVGMRGMLMMTRDVVITLLRVVMRDCRLYAKGGGIGARGVRVAGVR
jgi:hypothetical protein